MGIEQGSGGGVKALYNFSTMIAGFDFFFWLLMQKGATEIVFNTSSPKTDKWPIDTVRRRIDSICLPGAALLGLPYTIGHDGKQLGPYHQRDLVKLVNEGYKIPRLRTVKDPGKAKYTVTLRNTQRVPHRNSHEADWRQFAKKIGAVVIPDYDDEPIHLWDRMALYAGAEMNFGVTNGPITTCFLSQYPAMAFDLNIGPMYGAKVPYGEEYPFLMKDRHHQVYESGTYDVLMKHFTAWRENGEWL